MSYTPAKAYFEVYCRNSDCVVRETVVHVKNYGYGEPDEFMCPVCLGPMVKHWSRTVREQEATAKSDARASVWAQLSVDVSSGLEVTRASDMSDPGLAAFRKVKG